MASSSEKSMSNERRLPHMFSQHKTAPFTSALLLIVSVITSHLQTIH